ncbi:UNVERIFIED_CONTAM: hypothetical protein GTU68_007749 [Idotea baltica]|nr:hypothetical protein [Idotea baltica]
MAVQETFSPRLNDIYSGGNAASKDGFGNVNTREFMGSSEGGQPLICGFGEALDATGECVEATFTHKHFVFRAPPIPVVKRPAPVVPKPRIDYNIVFVRTPERPDNPEPIVVPPPQKRTLVYVLTENGEAGQQIIEVPSAPHQPPEVIYVNYNEGDNPTLGDKFSLQEILAQQAREGQILGGDKYELLQDSEGEEFEGNTLLENLGGYGKLSNNDGLGGEATKYRLEAVSRGRSGEEDLSKVYQAIGNGGGNVRSELETGYDRMNQDGRFGASVGIVGNSVVDSSSRVELRTNHSGDRFIQEYSNF